jgi:hypothetical protein
VNNGYHQLLFTALLHEDDARRATAVVRAVLARGLPCALTGGLAIAARLRTSGRRVERRALNDVDLVVPSFADIPESLAAAFLLNHVHPDAAEGRTLLQLIAGTERLRIDLFRAFGATLARATTLEEATGALRVVSIEDLVARTTAMVCGQLREGRPVDAKHVTAFNQLLGLGRRDRLDLAWADHRQNVPGTLADAVVETTGLLRERPELVVVEEYSTQITPCDRCRPHGVFRPAAPERIVQILGYW